MDCGSLSASEDTSNEEKLGSEDVSCVKGSRMRKPVLRQQTQKIYGWQRSKESS